MQNGTEISTGERSFTNNVFGPIKITREQFIDLLIPFRHSPHIRAHAAALIISRVQLVSALFMVLVPLCSIIDWFTFPLRQWVSMLFIRIGASVIFLALAWPWRSYPTRMRADLMLLVMLLVPPFFYLLSVDITSGGPLKGFPLLVIKLYALMPNIVLAGLAIFPLTALEVLFFSLPAFALSLICVMVSSQPLSLVSYIPQLWLMVLVMGVSMFSGMSQLHYMAALVHRAMIDPLTGAFTRRSGGEALELSFRLASLQNLPLVLAFFDIDRFKLINDHYGHEAGDEVLKAAAFSMRQGLRKGDVLVRWGGEEFVAILNNTDIQGARLVIERLYVTGFGCQPDGQPVTVSIGLSERSVDMAADWKVMIELADQRMYEAKKTGRARAMLPGNQVITYASAQVCSPQ